jgi:hypothetical protein
MNKLRWVFILAGMFFIFPTLAFAVADKDYFVGAYYYPWYNNNNFHGSLPLGSSTLIYYLNPQQTPELGWYNQWNPAVISQHYKWARYAGINFFVTSYWSSGSVELSHFLMLPLRQSTFATTISTGPGISESMISR